MLFKMGNKAFVPDVTTTYQTDHHEGSYLLDQYLRDLNAESRKAVLETKIIDGDDLATPLIISASDGNLDFVKVLLRYEASRGPWNDKH